LAVQLRSAPPKANLEGVQGKARPLRFSVRRGRLRGAALPLKSEARVGGSTPLCSIYPELFLYFFHGEGLLIFFSRGAGET